MRHRYHPSHARTGGQLGPAYVVRLERKIVRHFLFPAPFAVFQAMTRFVATFASVPRPIAEVD